jgi:hypothetical protein
MVIFKQRKSWFGIDKSPNLGIALVGTGPTDNMKVTDRLNHYEGYVVLAPVVIKTSVF